MADVASTLAAWLSTTDSNSPSGSTNIGTGLDNNLREIQGVVVRGLSHKGADIASATAPALGAVEGLMHDITGTATITGFDTVRAGILKILKFEGAATLTHNATSLILPGGANITTADGDVAFFISEGSGNWRCLNYERAATLWATQAQQETATSNLVAVTPGVQHFHPSAIKAAVRFNASGTIAYNYNITSITDSGAGDWSVVIATDFSGAGNSVGVGMCGRSNANGCLTVNCDAASEAGTYHLSAIVADGTTRQDPDTPDEVHVIFTGDFA